MGTPLCANLFLDADDNLVQYGKHQRAHGVDADGDADFRDGRGVFIDFMQRVGDESARNHPQTFVDPGADNDHGTAHRQGDLVFACDGIDGQDDTQNHQRHGGPHPGNIEGVAVDADKQVLDGVHVARDIAVKRDEYFTQEEKDVNADGVGHRLAKALDLLLARIEIAHLAHEQA